MMGIIFRCASHVSMAEFPNVSLKMAIIVFKDLQAHTVPHIIALY